MGCNVLSDVSKIYGCFRQPECRGDREITYLLGFKAIPMHIYMISLEERSVFRKVVVSVMCPVTVSEIELFHCIEEQHSMSSHELQNALMLTVEFSKMYYTR
jgi:hypothetical protein